MKIQSLKLVCFSPTGTTKAIVQGVGRGINPGKAELIDITQADAREQPLPTAENELLVVAVPVYMGRVPALLSEWLQAITARETPAVGIVVYGNRAYDDALLELKDSLMKRGCIPIALGHILGNTPFPVPKRQPPQAVLMRTT